jgi:hypothetical protein
MYHERIVSPVRSFKNKAKKTMLNSRIDAKVEASQAAEGRAMKRRESNMDYATLLSSQELEIDASDM